MSEYVGPVELGATLTLDLLAKDTSGTPKLATALPTFRIYDENGLVAGATGTLAARQTGTITAASNANPIVITSVGHGLTGKPRVNIAGVNGNTSAVGDFTLTVLNADTFSLDGSAGNGNYTSGGVWTLAGTYKLSQVIASPNFASGKTYSALISYTVSSVAMAQLYRFTVS